jgi:hypothetical protein
LTTEIIFTNIEYSNETIPESQDIGDSFSVLFDALSVFAKGRAREVVEKFSMSREEPVDSQFLLRFLCTLLSGTKSKTSSNRSSVTSMEKAGASMDKNLELIKSVLRLTSELSKIEEYCDTLLQLQPTLVELIKRSGL